MRRWDLEYEPGNYVGAGDSVLVPRNGGDWVDYDDHLAELRQTQRQMIAALYWRAGHYEIESRRPLQTIHMEARMRGAAFAMERTARSMEAACPR